MDARIDVAAMYAGAQHTSDDVMVDDGTGTVTVFLVDDFRRVRVEDSAVSKFDSGESNAVLWRNVWMSLNRKKVPMGGKRKIGLLANLCTFIVLCPSCMVHAW